MENRQWAIAQRPMKKMSSSQGISGHSFLLEFQVEDIPARFLPGSRRWMRQSVEEWLKSSALTDVNVDVWVTCRRLALLLGKLPEYIPGKNERVLGPRVTVLKDEQGNFLPQVTAYAKAKGIEPEKLFLEETVKGLTLAYDRVVAPMKVLEKIEKELLPKILAMPFPKSMRWTSPYGEFRFARPIRQIAALWDARVLRSWRVLGLRAADKSVVARKSVVIRKAQDYVSRLRKEGIRLNIEERRERLRDGLNQQAGHAVPTAIHFDHLFQEALDLVETPQVLDGYFDKKYLDLPPEVLLAILEKSKLFGVAGKLAPEGHASQPVVLEPKFLAVLEKTATAKALRQVRRGYERLVASRFFDAWFFWEQDLKVPLSDQSRRQKLEGIAWSKELGSVAQKVDRVRKTAASLALLAKAQPSEVLVLERAAHLFKTDLTTMLVGEYPDLSGLAGSYYALRESDECSRSASKVISDAAQDIAATPLGKLLALADRFDTLLAQFATGHQPTAKEDPLGLKRLADSVIDILWLRAMEEGQASVSDCLKTAWVSFPAELKNSRQDLLNYFRGRLAIKIESLGLARDRIEAILSATPFEPLPIFQIRRAAEALKALEGEQFDNLEKLAALFKRVANILRQAKESMSSVDAEVDETLLQEFAEQELWRATAKTRHHVNLSLARQGYGEIFLQLALLTGPLEGFFNDVMVMVEQESLRKNRLALLENVRQIVLLVMDPSKLTLKKPVDVHASGHVNIAV